MKKRSNFLIIAMVMFGLSTLLSSCSQPEKHSVIDKIQKSGELTIATSGNQFPFSFKDTDGNFRGIDIMIGNGIAERMGVKAKFVEVDLSNIIATVKEGKADLAISGLSVTAKRNETVMFTKPYFITGKGVLSTKKGVQQAKEGTAEESKITIAVVDNSSSLEYAIKHYSHAHLVKTKNLLESREVLFTGKVDGLLADYEICESFSFDKRNNGEYNFKRIGDVNDNEFISIAVTPGDALFFNTVNNLIQTVKTSQIDALVEQSWMMYLN